MVRREALVVAGTRSSSKTLDSRFIRVRAAWFLSFSSRRSASSSATRREVDGPRVVMFVAGVLG